MDSRFLNGVHNFHGTGILFPKSMGKLTVLLHRKLKNIDPAQFENTDFLDDLNKAREGIPGNTFILYDFISLYLFLWSIFPVDRGLSVYVKAHAVNYFTIGFYSCHTGPDDSSQGVYKTGRTERATAQGE